MQASFVYVFRAGFASLEFRNALYFCCIFSGTRTRGKDWEFEASRPPVPPAAAEAVTEKPEPTWHKGRVASHASARSSLSVDPEQIGPPPRLSVGVDLMFPSGDGGCVSHAL